MTTRMSGRAAARVALFAAAAIAVAMVGNGWAFQPAGKGKEPAKAAPVHPAVAAAQDEYDLLAAQAKLKQAAVEAADKRAKMEDALLKRLDGIGTGVEVAQQRAAADRAKTEAEQRTGELGILKLQLNAAKQRLEAVTANPPKAGGPSATEESLAKLVQLLAERNKTEKDWMDKEDARQTKEAKAADERATAAEKRYRDAEERAEARAKEAEAQAKAEWKKRLDAEADRVRQEKLNALRRLPGEVADTELRLRATELKREQAKLELDALAREIDRLKTAKADLEELRATLEKELKAKNDK